MAEYNEAEKEYLFAKRYTCPVCDKEIKVQTVKTGKARVNGTDDDLRPRYEGIDALKYDAILCPYCGYAALSRFFETVTQVQKKQIKEGVAKFYKPREDKEILSYTDALERHKLALISDMVKGAKDSEKAYTCLKTAWLLRGERQELEQAKPLDEKKQAGLLKEEQEFLKKAKEGFLSARQTEEFPMCGMDETTVDYLLAVLHMQFEEYEMSSRLVSGILTSFSASARVKDRARDLKEVLTKKMKETKKDE